MKPDPQRIQTATMVLAQLRAKGGGPGVRLRQSQRK